MKLYMNNAEYRSFSSVESKNGIYFLGHFEDYEGKPFRVYLGKTEPNIFKKGEVYSLEFEYNEKYKNLNFIGKV